MTFPFVFFFFCLKSLHIKVVRLLFSNLYQKETAPFQPFTKRKHTPTTTPTHPPELLLLFHNPILDTSKGINDLWTTTKANASLFHHAFYTYCSKKKLITQHP
jgi:hypothetical protein